MDETLRDVINDAIRDRLMETHKSEFDAANEEARDLCDAIFDALEIEPEFQDVSWETITEGIYAHRKPNSTVIRFDYKVRTEVCTRFGERGFIMMLGCANGDRKKYLVETATRTAWMEGDDFTVSFYPA